MKVSGKLEVQKTHYSYDRLQISNSSLHFSCWPGLYLPIWEEEENQLDATQWFIELLICLTSFRHVYAHHQELTTILLVWHVECNSWLLVVGRSGAGQQAMRPG